MTGSSWPPPRRGIESLLGKGSNAAADGILTASEQAGVARRSARPRPGDRRPPKARKDVGVSISGTTTVGAGSVTVDMELRPARWLMIATVTFNPSEDVTADTRVYLEGYGDADEAAFMGWGNPVDERPYAPHSRSAGVSMRFTTTGFYQGGGTYTWTAGHSSPLPGSTLSFYVSGQCLAVYLGPA